MEPSPEGQQRAFSGDAADGALHRLAQSIASLCACDTEAEVVEVVRRTARGLCGAAGIAIIWREGESCHYVAEDSAVPLWSGQRFSSTSCISGWAMNNGSQVAIPDIYQDTRVPHEAYRPTGIRSLVMTPVGEPPAAALGAYWMEVREPSDQEKAVLKALAGAMAAVLRTLAMRQSLEAELLDAELRRAERETARQEIAFQAHLLDVVHQAVIATDLAGRVIYWNAFAERLYGWTKEEAKGRTVLELKAVPEAPQEAERLMRELQAGKSWSGEMILRRKDGSQFPASVSDWPIIDANGELVGIVGVSVDNTDKRRADDHQQMLINELNHRVKNSLAIVQSIASQTLKPEMPTREVRGLFEARLHALARAHGLMIDVGWRPVPLIALLVTALEPFGPGDRIELDGPDLKIEPRAAVSIALAAHELATNALKYGALSTPQGKVHVSWRATGIGEDDTVHLAWREAGGPPVGEPKSRGFGSRLIERGLAADLNGKAELSFLPSGVVCEIEAPSQEVLAPDAEGRLFPLPC